MCFCKFLYPSATAATFSWSKSVFKTPPFIFNARAVATITMVSGVLPKTGVLISRNFSAPRSAPKPASVIV